LTFLRGLNDKEVIGMFYKKDESGYREIVDGVLMKPLVHGEKTLLIETNIKKGAVHNLHSHPHEQTGYLVSGKLMMIIGDERFEAEPGDSWCVPGGVEHSGEILEDSVIVEVFSPVREEYLS
jgi:quercetin dioxygenase-like cupin family protein